MTAHFDTVLVLLIVNDGTGNVFGLTTQHIFEANTVRHSDYPSTFSIYSMLYAAPLNSLVTSNTRLSVW